MQGPCSWHPPPKASPPDYSCYQPDKVYEEIGPAHAMNVLIALRNSSGFVFFIESLHFQSISIYHLIVVDCVHLFSGMNTDILDLSSRIILAKKNLAYFIILISLHAVYGKVMQHFPFPGIHQL